MHSRLKQLVVLPFLMVWLGLCAVQYVHAQGTPSFQSLAGEARTFSTNALDTAFADPGFDDSSWERTQLPNADAGDPDDPLHAVVWYRIAFDVSDKLPNESLAFIGAFHREYEIYLNGVLIDAVSGFGVPGLTPWAQASHGQSIVVPLRDDHLKRSETNVLAIRLARIVFLERVAVLSQPFGLAPAQSVLADHQSYVQKRATWDGLQIGINGLLAVFGISLLILGFRDNAARWFAALISGYLALVVYASQWAANFGLHVPAIYRVILVAFVVTIVANLGFSASLLGRQLGRFIWVVAAILSISTLPGFGVYGAFSPDIAITLQAASSVLFMVVYILPLLWIIWASWLEARAENPIGWYMLLLYGSLVGLPIVLNIAFPVALANATFTLGIRPQDGFVQLFILSLTGLFAHRLVRIERERKLANQRALTAQQNERQRVARDLHDSIGQSLSALKLRSQSILASFAPNEGLAKHQLDALVQGLDGTLTDTRRIARDLSPSAVEHYGFEGAVSRLADQLRQASGTEVDVRIDADITLDKHTADQLFRIVQEASSNAIRHGNASRVLIALSRSTDSHRTLIVEDDGAGFAPKETERGLTLGLASMKERTDMLGGTFLINSDVGSGTRVKVTL